MGKFRILETLDPLVKIEREIEKEVNKPFRYTIDNFEPVIKPFLKKDEYIYSKDKQTHELAIYYTDTTLDREEYFLYYFGKESTLFVVNEIKNELLKKYKEHRTVIVQKKIEDYNLPEEEKSFFLKKNNKEIEELTIKNFFYKDKLGKTAGSGFKTLLITSPYCLYSYNFTVRPAAGRNFKRKTGETSIEVLEITPILLALQELKRKINYKNLNIDETKAESMLNEYQNKDTKTKEVTYYQAKKIQEILEENDDYEIHRADKIFTEIKQNGVRLYTKAGEKALHPDNYNPSDFFLVNKKIKNKEYRTLADYNHQFANNLLNGDRIQNAFPYPYIGISQKKSSVAAGGRAGQYFSVVKASTFGDLSTIKKINVEDLKTIIKDLFTVIERTPFIKIKKSNLKYFISSKNLISKYKMIKSVYNVCTNGGEKTEVKEEYFEDLVKFSISMEKELNPCFYKLIGGEISVMNPERMSLELDIENRDLGNIENKKKGKNYVTIEFDKKFIILTIPIFFDIDDGSQKRKDYYKIDIPFIVKENSFDPIVQNIDHAEKLEFKEIVKMEKRKAKSLLYSLGKEKEFNQLERYWQSEMYKTWFKNYTMLIYNWMLEIIKIEKDKNANLRYLDMVENQINEELNNIKEGYANRREAYQRFKAVLWLFNQLPNVKFNERTFKYVFESISNINNIQQKISEFLEKLDQFK